MTMQMFAAVLLSDFGRCRKNLLPYSLLRVLNPTPKPNAKELHLRSEVWCATVHLSIFGAFVDILLDCTLLAIIT